MIVESFGGRMEVDSTVGQGTTMTVVLPVSRSARQPVAGPCGMNSSRVSSTSGLPLDGLTGDRPTG
jgi:hypothetical protein